MRWPKLSMAAMPTGIRAWLPDGRVVELEPVYRGREQGLDVWDCVAPLDAVDMRIAMLPPRTRVVFQPGYFGLDGE